MNNVFFSSSLDRHGKVRSSLWLIIIVLAVALAGCHSAGSVSHKLDQAAHDLSNHDYRSAEIRAKSVLKDDNANGRAWLLLARSSLARHRYEDAAHQFEQARANGQPAADLTVGTARAYLGAQKYQKALDELHGLPSENSKNKVELLTLRGNALAGLKKPDEAGQAYDNALKIDASAAEALIGKAQLRADAGDRDQALALLQRAVKAHPNDIPAVAALARFNYIRNQCAPALDGFSKALNSKDYSLDNTAKFQLRALAADCQLRLGRNDKAQHNIDVLIKAAPQNAYANYLQGLLNLRQGDYAQAATHLQRVLNIDPDNLRTLTLLAYVAIARNDAETAQSYLSRVLAKQPDNVDALRLRAGLYLKKGNRDQALDILRNAYKDNADTPGLRPLLAQVMASLAKGNDASGESASKGGSLDPALQLDLAAAMAQQGSVSAATTVLDNFKPANDKQRIRAALVRIRIDLDAGHNDKAVAEAKKLAAAEPDNVNVLRGLARVYELAGQQDEAARTLAHAHRQAPDNQAVVQDQIKLAVQRGQLDSARGQIQSLLANSPDNASLILQLAQVQALSRNNDAMLSTLEQAHSRQPDNTDIARALVRAYLVMNQTSHARKLAEQLVSDHPDQADLLRLAGMTQLAAHDNEKALASLKRAVDASQNDPSYRLDLAQVEMAAGHDADALTLLQQIRSDTPAFSPAGRMLALAQARDGKMDDALATVDSLKSDSAVSSAELEKLRGDVLVIGKRYADAAKAYEKVYNAQPSRAAASDLFEARRRAGIKQPERSLVDWLKRSPKDVAVALLLAQWYQSQDNPQAAAKAYQVALKAQDDNAVALNNLALIMQNKGDNKTALAMARKAHAAAPNSPAVTDTLGWLLVQTGNNPEGLKYLRDAADKAGNVPDIEYHLAYALSRAGQQHKTEARKILKKVLSSNQKFDDRDNARQLLDKLPADQGSSGS
ncbi:MAG: PEP-CTERM system TPR-repeat protein PrsT [Salinisphaera sp.]|nr:PEP-CTERM system TPR-repeat protein PrsT [Salinisphaera sp.]